ncbi:MAG: response regulator [Acidobacteriota bacterium]
MVLADDHTVFREGIRALLEARGGFQVVGEAATGAEAVDCARRLKPDVVVMDIAMPGMNGLDATREIRRADSDTQVLILTMHGEDDFFFLALEAGASGYILKEAASTDLVKAIETVAGGGVFLYPSLAVKLVDDYLARVGTGEERASYESLTPRQREILQLIGQGLTNREIADRLALSIHTVQAHRSHITDKLGLQTRAQLVSYAARMGLLSSSS